LRYRSRFRIARVIQRLSRKDIPRIAQTERRRDSRPAASGSSGSQPAIQAAGGSTIEFRIH
jgi:hypothetical protein